MVLKEAKVGAIIGAVAGFGMFLIGMIWSENLKFAFTITTAVFLNCIFGACIGSLSPVLFATLRLDPALMSGPLGNL